MKIIKWLLIVLATIVLLGSAFVYFSSEKKPEALANSNGDELAQKMLNALSIDSFKSTRYFNWNFVDRHSYFYDQTKNNVIVTWENNHVQLDLDTQKGISKVDGIQQSGEAHQALIDNAWSYWCNDSFWMLAPFKVFDPGTKRTVVDENGKEALMVEYASGGVTPGDSYLWILGDDYIPTGYKMWTSIIPIKGLYASWDNWKNVNGALYATQHKLDKIGYVIEMKDFLASNELKDFGFDKNPFE